MHLSKRTERCKTSLKWLLVCPAFITMTESFKKTLTLNNHLDLYTTLLMRHLEEINCWRLWVSQRSNAFVKKESHNWMLIKGEPGYRTGAFQWDYILLRPLLQIFRAHKRSNALAVVHPNGFMHCQRVRFVEKKSKWEKRRTHTTNP